MAISEKDPIDGNGDFVKAEKRQSNARRSRIKRATVVGNPMFSSEPSQDNESGDGLEEAGLSLDDLDMDYEQIMQYFDNLKVSEISLSVYYTWSINQFQLFCLNYLGFSLNVTKTKKGIECLNE